MFKGLLFFVRFGWNHRKRYIIYLLLDQFISSFIPLAAIVIPKFIIEELMGKKRIEYVALWVAILLVYVLLASIASNFLRGGKALAIEPKSRQNSMFLFTQKR